MRRDLNDQFQRAQSAAGGDNTSEKVIVIVAAVVFLMFVGIIVGITVFFVKTADKIIETPAATNINPSTAEQIGDQVSTIYDYGTTGTTASSSSSNTKSSFVYGVIDGQSYSSSFSGLTFNAPEDWILTSYESSIPGNSPRDMSASGDGISIVVQYELMSVYGYEKATDALESTRTTASSTNNSLVEDDLVVKWGGNKFKGLIYKKTVGTTLVTYYEVLVTEVNGYALKITISATTLDDIAIARSYFK